MCLIKRWYVINSMQLTIFDIWFLCICHQKFRILYYFRNVILSSREILSRQIILISLLSNEHYEHYHKDYTQPKLYKYVVYLYIYVIPWFETISSESCCSQTNAFNSIYHVFPPIQYVGNTHHAQPLNKFPSDR